MKFIKTLFFQILVITSVLVSFNVYAAKQSICNPNTNVVLHDDGSLKSCQLKDNYDVNNSTCKNGGPISFYSNGELESCVLYKAVTISNSNCKADALIYFFIDGNLKSCMKQEN
jgi:antitoxin component YwqK of YwqJK toxin-antitoxin module